MNRSTPSGSKGKRSGGRINLELANDSQYGLTGAIFSNNREHVERAREQFLDQIIGTDGDYFPAWSDRFHLRWLYRLYKEPRRLWKRYFLDYPRFLGVFVADWYRTRGGSR